METKNLNHGFIELAICRICHEMKKHTVDGYAGINEDVEIPFGSEEYKRIRRTIVENRSRGYDGYFRRKD